jgi:hypothetical protein
VLYRRISRPELIENISEQKPLVVANCEVLFGDLEILNCLQKFGFEEVRIDMLFIVAERSFLERIYHDLRKRYLQEM